MFAALAAEQLAHVMDANPTRHYVFQTGKWNAEQFVVLATRSYPLSLSFGIGFTFTDGGIAFADALHARKSLFGCRDLFSGLK